MQLPEGKTLSPQEQLANLLERLERNDPFRRRRGTLGGLLSAVEPLLDAARSPTAFLREYDALVADFRGLAGMLAQLRRDGHTVALGELTLALQKPNYRMTGERTPIEQTVPCTILILDFHRTLTMIRWLCAGKPWEIRKYINHHEVGDLTTKLFAEYPTLRNRALERMKNTQFIGDELRDAYKDTVLVQFERECKSMPHAARTLEVASETFPSEIELGGTWGYSCFGFMIPGARKSDLLPLFKRETQREIGMWQVRIPKAYLEKAIKEKLKIGFCQESAWKDLPQKNEAGLVSEACSHGYGACIFSHLTPNAFRDRYKGTGFSFVLETRDL